MPKLSVWAVRAALLYLAAGFTFGALLLANKGVSFWPGSWRLFPAHIEFLTLGWTTQLALAVGFWIFPRFGRSRGNVTLAWVAFGLLNVGVLLVAAEGIFQTHPGLMFTGRTLEVAGAAAFLFHAWERIKPMAG
ncbi:MAG TPA: hypothetical protein VI451_03595 [Anaerolineales bacterium]|nr:hypothetical protein [Anaerolineales bacterium]